MYALIQNGQVAQYPYSISQLYADNLGVSFPITMPDERLAEWNVLPVTPMLPPAYDASTHKLVEQTPALVFGAWEQTWALVPLTQDEINARNQQIKDEITARVQERLDLFAQTKGYDNIVSACSYATSQHLKYGPEGRYCVTAREQTWDAMFAIEADVIAGNRPMPAGYEDIKAELPALVWPV